jgi:hypothetical protein
MEISKMIGEQLTIPQLMGHLAQTHTEVGKGGELMIARALEAVGYAVSLAHTFGDLTVVDKHGEIFYVEVKTARRGRDGKWRFTLYKRWQGRVCTNHVYTDFVVLVCALKTGDCIPFVVPTSELLDKHQAVITSYPTDYKGRLAHFRQNLRKMTLERML